jgi:hypothetical protein
MGKQVLAEVKSGWASYSYKADPANPKSVLYTPDAVFAEKDDADWFGACMGSGRMGFPHPVRWVEIDGKAYVLGEEPAEVGLNRYGERVGDAAEDVYAATPGG